LVSVSSANLTAVPEKVIKKNATCLNSFDMQSQAANVGDVKAGAISYGHKNQAQRNVGQRLVKECWMGIGHLGVGHVTIATQHGMY